MRNLGLGAFLVRALQALLAMCALFLCIRALALVGLPETRGPEGAKELRVEDAASARVPADRFAVIGARDLFHRKVVEPEPPAPPPVVESTLDVELLGTLVAGSADSVPEGIGAAESTDEAKKSARPSSVAILRDVDGKIRTLAKGELFADEHAKLVAIERGRIVLEQSGRLETVMLEESAVAAAKNSAARPTYNAPRDPVAVAAAARDAEVARLQREVQRRMREAMPQVGAAQPTTARN